MALSFLTLLVTVACFFRPTLAFSTAGGRIFQHRSKQLNDATQSSIKTLITPMMATKAYDYKQPRPFIMPLLQDPDVVQEFGDTCASGKSISRTLVSDDDDTIIDYLPWFVLQQQLTPQAKQCIAQATRQHVFGDTRSDPKVNVTAILSMIQDEFKCTDVPVVIGGNTYDDDHIARILSFAAYHRLPKEITALLFGTNDSTNTPLAVTAFLENGWNNVIFPRGLAIRLPRNRLSSNLDRYQPIPRRWLPAHNAHVADRAIQEAASVSAPPRRLLSREAFLNSLQKEMASSNSRTMGQAARLPFFPNSNHKDVFRMVRRSIVRTKLFLQLTSMRLQESIRAVLLSYSVLAFSWYNASFLWQWQRLSASFALSSSSFPLAASLQRVGAVMTNVYYSSNSMVWMTPFSMLVALGLAPVAHKVLLNRNPESPNNALLMLCTVLAVAHVGIGAGILFVDATILRSVMLLP